MHNAYVVVILRWEEVREGQMNEGEARDGL